MGFGIKSKISLFLITLSLSMNAESIQNFQTNKKIETKKIEEKEIRSMVAQIIIDELDVNRGKISDNRRLVDDLGADSFSLVVIVVRLEEKFNIVIKDEVLEKIKTVRDLINAVKNN